MNNILVLLPEDARLYSESLAGIRRRFGNDYQERIIDYAIDPSTLRRLIAFYKPRGCIVFAWNGARSLSARNFARIPTVYMDRSKPSGGQSLDVIQDYAEGGRLAAHTLICGNRSGYAFVGDGTASKWSNERGMAFANAIRLHGHACHVYAARRRPNGDTRSLESWLRKLPRPVSIFAANDRTACDVLSIAELNGWHVPGDVAVLGIDNIASLCESSRPRLSSIITDFERGGWEAADLLCARLKSTKLNGACRRYGTLGVIHRGSTRTRQDTSGFSIKVKRALHTIHNRAADGLTVEDIAAEMGCSRRLAEIRFRQATGSTIKAAITDVRLERAQALVRNRALPLKAIAAACGYRTVNALRTAYRKRFEIPMPCGGKAPIRNCLT